MAAVGLLVPLVPNAVEVDPETPVVAVPLRLPALVPSLLGLPLRLVPAVLSLVVPTFSLTWPEAVLLAIVAFESIQLSVRVSVPRIRQPVMVTRCGVELVDDAVPVVPRRVVSVCPLLVLDGVDFVVGCLSDVCGYV
jgi:hypothetical protein